ncbi:MAG: DUF523 domain-containing protein [bacterium]
MIRLPKKALVSACLLGVRCRHDGGHSKADIIGTFSEEVDLIPVCPEQLGGLSTPRPPVQLSGGDGGDVIDGKARVLGVDDGEDRTAELLRGASTVLDLARLYGVKEAYLKGRSPSCGCGAVWCDGEKVAGDGVTTALLKRHGIQVREVNP